MDVIVFPIACYFPIAAIACYFKFSDEDNRSEF
jgi:hypothetical protein